MSRDNPALKSWLPQAGTVERTFMLKKLKRDLEGRGMTRQEVYKGLLQLASTARVLMKKWHDPRYFRQQSRAHTNIVNHGELSSLEAIERNSTVVCDEGTTESKECVTRKIMDDRVDSPRAAKSKTPELLDERVGNESQFFNRISRKAITLNLSRDKVAHRQTGPSTEIRMADSSVADIEMNPAIGSSIVREIRKSDNARLTGIPSKKPKIVEDVTCIEGTIFTRESLKNSPATAKNHSNINEATPNGRINEIEEEKDARLVRTTDILRNKMRARLISYASKKQRLRRKFRQIFGTDLTLSELEEEDDMIERYVRKRRVKRGRNSSDSGVGSVDLNSEDVMIVSRTNCSELWKNREIPHKQEPSRVPEIQEGNNFSSKPSMPLLDSLSDENASLDTIVEALPDSSTSLNLLVKPDSSIDESSESSEGKLIISESPRNIESPDLLTPANIEKEVEVQCLPSTPTPTTGYISSSPTPRQNDNLEKSPETQNQDLSKLLDIDVFNENRIVILNGNTISIQETPQCIDSHQDEPKEPLKVPNESPSLCQSTTVTLSTISSPVIITIPTWAFQTGGPFVETINRDNVDNEIPQSSIAVVEGPSIRKDLPDECHQQESMKPCDPIPTSIAHEPKAIDEREKTISEETETCPPPFSAPLPKLRVLHPSELGSRWCPTPLNNDASSLHHGPTDPAPSCSFVSPISTGYCLPTSTQPNQVPQSNPIDYSNRRVSNHASIPSGSNIANAPILHDNSSSTNNFGCTRETCNALPNSCVSGPVSSDFRLQYLLGSTVRVLMSLDWCIGRNKSVYTLYDVLQLNRNFDIQKDLLWQCLRNLSSIIGTSNLEWIVDYIVKRYEAMTSPERRFFNKKKVISIITMKKLPTAPLFAGQAGSQTHYASSVTSGSSHRSIPPPPYPTPASYNVPETRAASSAPRQTVFSINSNLSAFTAAFSRQGSSLSVPPIRPKPTILDPLQLAQLKDQIVMYNHLLTVPLKQSSQPRPRQRSKKRTKSSVPQTASTSAAVENPWNKENEGSVLPTLLEEFAPSSNREYRFNESATSSMMRLFENIGQPSNNGNRSNEQRQTAEDNERVERIGDIVQTLAEMSSESNIDPSRNDKGRLVESRTSDSLPINTDTPSIPPEINEIIEEVRSITAESTRSDGANKVIEEINESVSRCQSIVNDANNEDDKREAASNRVPVITLDDHDSADDTEDLALQEKRPNFSILDVKSISKDVFNNMGEKTSVAETLIDITDEQNINDDSVLMISETRECLRCGEPSSVACERCYEAFYCSPECHEAHWAASHHLTCKPVPAEALTQFVSGDISFSDSLVTQT